MTQLTANSALIRAFLNFNEWFTVSLPPTDNQCRLPRIVKGKPAMFPTKDYTDWKDKAKQEWNDFVDVCLKGATFPLYEPALNNQLSFDYRLFKDSDRTDNMNRTKPLTDFFHGKLFNDDRHVKLNLLLPVKIDKINPRIEVCLIPTVYS